MAEEKKSGRTYHVLKRVGESARRENSEWAYVTEIEASSADQAIRLTAVESGTGRYSAVPASNWTEIGVRVEIPAPRVIFDTDEPTAAVEDETVINVDDIGKLSVAVGEQETIDDPHGPSEATRAELRRQAAEREAQQA